MKYFENFSLLLITTSLVNNQQVSVCVSKCSSRRPHPAAKESGLSQMTLIYWWEVLAKNLERFVLLWCSVSIKTSGKPETSFCVESCHVPAKAGSCRWSKITSLSGTFWPSLPLTRPSLGQRDWLKSKFPPLLVRRWNLPRLPVLLINLRNEVTHSRAAPRPHSGRGYAPQALPPCRHWHCLHSGQGQIRWLFSVNTHAATCCPQPPARNEDRPVGYRCGLLKNYVPSAPSSRDALFQVTWRPSSCIRHAHSKHFCWAENNSETTPP